MNFAELMKITSLEKYTQESQIDIVGKLFDSSYDNNSLEGVSHAFDLSNQIDVEELTKENLTYLHYDLSNGWKYLRKLRYGETNIDWAAQREELTKEIFHLRKAISSEGFKTTIKERRCQIFTNLGNSFSYIGRFVEAQEYWNKALHTLPEFSMAIGNKGNGLFHYGRSLYDDPHANLFMIFSFHYLQEALKKPNTLSSYAEHGIQQLSDFLKLHIPSEYLSELPNLNEYNLAEERQLRNYQNWCLENTLYINPLNDLGSYNVASHDCLNLPTITIKSNRPPVYLNIFNQIKQEFGTARFSYYTSIQANKPHFSDLDIELIETNETVRYSYYVEQLKISFRLAYSILDKIAFLLNDYLELKIELRKVSFKNLWYSDLKKKELIPFLKESNNWALNGLFWLSKDFHEKENEFDSVLEPESKEIAQIRNFIEHRGFKVVSDFKLPNIRNEEIDISYAISRSDFEKKTIKLLKLTRAAIIYLALAVYHEENKRDYSSNKTMTIHSSLIPNNIKT